MNVFEIGAFLVLAFVAGWLMGYDRGKSLGLRIGKILGAVERDRELRQAGEPLGPPFRHTDYLKDGHLHQTGHSDSPKTPPI